MGIFEATNQYPQYPCQVLAGHRQYRKRDNGMVFQQNWPFTKLFNYHLFKMRERGILQQLQLNYWNKHMDTTRCESKGITHFLRRGIDVKKNI